MEGGTSLRMRAGQLFCACDSDGLPLDVGRMPETGSLRTMALAFALSVLAQSLSLSVLPLVSLVLAPSDSARAWPFIALLVGGALSSFPASILLDLFGRRAAFALGASLGLAGGVISLWSVLHGQFFGLVIGAAWLGMAQGFGLFYRHAGALTVQGGAGAVFKAGMAAAGLAPLLLWIIENKAGVDAGALTLALSGLVHLLTLGVAVTLPARRVGHARLAGTDQPDTASRWPARAVMLGATACAGLAWAVMTGVMSHAPLVMAGCGIGLSGSALGLALHLMAMYAPGLVIGRWVTVWGGFKVSLTGLAVLAAGSWLLAGADQGAALFAALVMAGGGWGIATIGATAWLHQQTQPSSTMLACHDLALFVCAIAGAASLSL